LVGKLNFRFATPATYIITPKRGTADRTAQLVYNINCATFVAQPQFGATSTQSTQKKKPAQTSWIKNTWHREDETPISEKPLKAATATNEGTHMTP